jgi:hypothetical protein
MVIHHLRLRERRWPLNMTVNAIGALACFVVLCIVVVSKFTEGAWIPTIVIPLVALAFALVKRHYTRFQATVHATTPVVIPVVHHTVVIPIGRITPAVSQAIGYARAMRPDHVVAVKVISDEQERADAIAEWSALGCEVPLDIVESPYRDLTGPILAYIDQLDSLRDDDLITVLIPEFVLHHWWSQALHNQSALALKARLLFRENTAVTSLPIHL